MMKWHRRRGSERGAVAVIVAVSMVALMGAAAVGVDLARLVYERQQLQNALDAAAAAGVLELPGPAKAAIDKATSFAEANMAAANLYPIVKPDIALRCVTAFDKVTKGPHWSSVRAICGIESKSWTALDCNEEAGVCSVPCTTDRCNTIVVKANKEVDYAFGPAIGIPSGWTGAVVSAACRTYCGTGPAKPMDIVLMADRTGSMGDDLDEMKVGIERMLGGDFMNQEQQYVAFGALGISAKSPVTATGSNKVKAVSGSNKAFTDADKVTWKNHVTSWNSQNKKWHFDGTWVPIQYSASYQKKVGSTGAWAMDPTSELGSAVRGLKESSYAGTYPLPWHLPKGYGVLRKSNYGNDQYDLFGTTSKNYGNTHLASALKGAVRYVLNTDPVKDLKLKDRSQFGPAEKVVIFETDGSPVEVFNSDDSALKLDNDLDIGATGDGSEGDPQDVVAKACENFLRVAQAAKDAKVTLIMIGVGGANNSSCGGKTVPEVLAEAASNRQDGTPSDGLNCNHPGNEDKENGDGDNYFCASDAEGLKDVFSLAFGSHNEKSTLMRLPNAANFPFP